MKTNTLIVFFIAFSLYTQAQVNLVPNPSFEDTVNCPFDFGQLDFSKQWFNPNSGSSDYFNRCYDTTITFGNGIPNNLMGSQNAFNGKGYAGLMASESVTWNIIYREYLAIKLANPLSSGISYYFSMYISLADSSRYATSKIGALFTNDSINKTNYDTINRSPQVQNPIGNFIVNKNSWHQLKGSFIASGGERYIYIGNFYSNNLTDTIAVANGGNLSNYNFPYYYIDNVCLSTDSNYAYNTYILGVDKQKINKKINIFPNPVLNDLQIENENQDKISIEIYSNTGINILSIFTQEKFVLINMRSFDKGIYYVKIIDSNGNINKKTIIKS